MASDGSVAIARAEEYRVDWVGPAGTVTSGPPIPFEPLSIGAAEQEEWFGEQDRNVGMMISITTRDGATTTTMQRGGGGGRGGEPDPSRYEWPETLPAVYPGRLPVDPLARACVRRYVRGGGPTTYDVFDRRGERLGTVELDPDRRVIGFGADAAYVVAFDEFNLNYLERYAMPAL